MWAIVRFESMVCRRRHVLRRPDAGEGHEPRNGSQIGLRSGLPGRSAGIDLRRRPDRFHPPVWRVDLFGSTREPAGTLDRPSPTPVSTGEPSRRNFVPVVVQPTRCPGWPGEPADPGRRGWPEPASTLRFSYADKAGLAAAAEIVATVKRADARRRAERRISAGPRRACLRRTHRLALRRK